jgi:16S rRNA processing protein RimM
VSRDQLSGLEADQFYWADLEGLRVQTIGGEPVGTVQYLYENVGTDILVVKDLKKERHIPFLMHDTIIKVDLEKGLILIDWDLTY